MRCVIGAPGRPVSDCGSLPSSLRQGDGEQESGDRLRMPFMLATLPAARGDLVLRHRADGLSLGFGFTGYLLPWNELAYFATKVGTEITGSVPVIGQFLGRLLRGGSEVTGATLTRFIEGEIVGIVAFGLRGLFLLLIPLLDRRTARGSRAVSFTWIGITIIAYMVVLTYLGYTASTTK